jgi:hypothetical protein
VQYKWSYYYYIRVLPATIIQYCTRAYYLFILYPVGVDYDDLNPRAVTVIVKIIIVGYRRKHSSIKSAPKSTVCNSRHRFYSKTNKRCADDFFFLEHFRPHQTPAVKLWPRLYNMQVVIAFARVPGDV